MDALDTGASVMFHVRLDDIEGWDDTEGLHHYTAVLDVGAEVLGSITVGFRVSDGLDDAWAARYVDAFAEQVDNLVFQVRQQAREARQSHGRDHLLLLPRLLSCDAWTLLSPPATHIASTVFLLQPLAHARARRFFETRAPGVIYNVCARHK